MQIAPELELHLGTALFCGIILTIFTFAIRATVRRNDVDEFRNGGLTCFFTGCVFAVMPILLISGVFGRAPGRNAWQWIEILGSAACSFFLIAAMWLTLYFRAGGRRALTREPEKDEGVPYIVAAVCFTVLTVKFPVAMAYVVGGILLAVVVGCPTWAVVCHLKACSPGERMHGTMMLLVGTVLFTIFSFGDDLAGRERNWYGILICASIAIWCFTMALIALGTYVWKKCFPGNATKLAEC